MSEVLPQFTFVRPKTVADAVAAFGAHAAARYVSGGTDLIPNIRRGLGAPEHLIDLTRIADMKQVTVGEAGAVIGAGVTLAELAQNREIAARYPAVQVAARSVAGPGHRAAGTVGGNLCLDTRCIFYNQSQWWREANDFCLKYQGSMCHVAPKSSYCHAAFSGDLAPVFLVLGATVDVAGPGGRRTIALPDLYGPDGQNYLALAPGEIVTGVHLPKDPPPATYEKMRVRGAIDFPLAGVAVALGRNGNAVGDLKVAVTGTNSRPFLVEGVDAFIGRALDEDALSALGELVQAQVSPMRTTSVSPYGRRRIAAALARRQAAALFGA